MAGVIAADSSLAFTWGIQASNALKEIAGNIMGWLSKGLIQVKNLVKNMIDGAKAIGESIIKGNFGAIIKKLIQEDPVAAVAGGIAIALIGGVVVGVVGTGLGLLASALSAIGGAIGIGGGITAAGILALVIPKCVQGYQAIKNFDFAKSDDALLKEVQDAFGNLANIAGESLGRALAGIIVGGGGQQPQLTINVRASATLYLMLEEQNKTEIHEEMFEALASLGWAMVRFAKGLAFRLAYINSRKWARQNVRTGIGWLDEKIKSWGLEEGKSWVATQKVESFVESVQETNPALGNFLEGFLEGFDEGFTEFIALKYA